MDKRPSVLIVGMGYGHIYLHEMMNRDTGADLVGVCDTDPHVAEKQPLLAEHNIPVYRDLQSFYAEKTADLAIIAAPIQFHTEMTLFCLAHGSNVLCEKPLCLTLEEANRMLEAEKAAGRFVCVGYQRDYRRDVWALKQDTLDGRYGRPLRLSVVHCYRRGANYYARNNWAGHITVNGREVFDSPFNNACAHNFQMLTFLLGEKMDAACDVTGLEGELYRGNENVENYDIAALRYTTTAGAPIYYYTAHPLERDVGPHGVLEFEKGTITFEGEEPQFTAVMNNGVRIDYTHVDAGSGAQKLYDALDCIKNGGAPICGVQADFAHIRAVRMAQALPICPVRPELITRVEENNDRFTYVRDLEKIFLESAKQWKLPGEAGFEL